MAIWAIADLHLSFGVPDKEMDIFGAHWKNHPEKIAVHWKEIVKDDDLVLIPGDISWALRLADVQTDLDWIGSLPGTKVMIKGNHDLWWPSQAKLQQALPPSLHALHNNVFYWKDWAIAGSRLWDSNEYNFDILFPDMPEEENNPQKTAENEKIFVRELQRLELSLKAIKPQVQKRIAMTHYPPIGLDLTPSRVSKLLEQYGINYCVFGHMHNVPQDKAPFGKARGIEYHLTAADHLDFKPLLIVE